MGVKIVLTPQLQEFNKILQVKPWSITEKVLSKYELSV